MSIFRRSATFVGRGPELQALREAYQDPAVHTALICGAAGIGKSRLVDEFVSRLGPRPRVLTGRCVQFGNDTVAYAPFLLPLRELSIVSPADFGQVLTAVERAAAERPLVVVLEDLHWADPSSLHLLAFLVANLDAEGVLLVATFRSPGGRLRQVVAELSRLPAVRVLTPAPLSRHETGRQLAALLGREPEPTLVTRVFQRSQGNPLFIEALGDAPEDNPAELLELLVAGLPELTADGSRVLALAAVAGTTVEHDVLAAVAELPEFSLHRALRELVDGQVLVAAGAGYEFRHALIRQAVYDRLLPAERTGLHRQFAAVLSAMPERVAQLAAHAYAAGEHACALRSAWQAALRTGPGAEHVRLHLLERVLELWAQVDDKAGLDRLTVLDHAAEAGLATNAVAAGLRWSAEALAAAPDPRRYYRQAVLKSLGHGDGRDELHRALRLLPEASPLRGDVLAALAIGCIFAGDLGPGGRYAAAALEVAEQVGSPSLLARAHAYLGLAAEGDPTAAARHFAAARATADPLTMIDVAVWESALHVSMGAYRTAVEVVQAGLRTAHETFQYEKRAPVLVVKWVQALTALGEWAQALDLIDEALGEPDRPRLSQAALRISRGEIHLARGDRAAAAADADCARRLLGDGPAVRRYRIRLGALDIRLAPDRAGEIYAGLADGLAAYPHEAWALVAAKAGAPGPAEVPDIAVVGPVDEAYRAMARGDREAAARGWRALAQPYELSLCQGGAPRPAPGRPAILGLTAREVEVLHLVAEGRSNRQIAAELFISSNTAGVHVSRILAKLGAATRTEAARRFLDARGTGPHLP
ncbi:ATP-binding protein [Actinoplanes subtropicus]|uniref:ATP-binding protein n=1 Tax=Actinoplanes subtropicus TaxID=543632 RepID=UPI000AA61BC0|nr:helix-turn-helix transcriptional regulator [Actinoplanes subtropicus]